jgi:hypothetical protein
LGGLGAKTKRHRTRAPLAAAPNRRVSPRPQLRTLLREVAVAFFSWRARAAVVASRSAHRHRHSPCHRCPRGPCKCPPAKGWRICPCPQRERCTTSHGLGNPRPGAHIDKKRPNIFN